LSALVESGSQRWHWSLVAAPLVEVPHAGGLRRQEAHLQVTFGSLAGMAERSWRYADPGGCGLWGV